MLEKGLKHTSRTVVLPDNFALAMGSGDLPVLATPALVALMEMRRCWLLRLNSQKGRPLSVLKWT